MYFLIHVVVIFDSSIWEGGTLSSVPVDPVDDTCAVAVYCDSIAGDRMRAREVVGIVLQKLNGGEKTERFGSSGVVIFTVPGYDTLSVPKVSRGMNNPCATTVLGRIHARIATDV